MTELGDQRCAQPICRHRRKEHLDGADGHDHHCTLCPCSAYVSGPRMVGSRLTYADLSLFQVVEGLLYAFPKATRRVLRKAPLVTALHAGLLRHKRLAEYLASERRIPFNEQGIFRSYPELDG